MTMKKLIALLLCGLLLTGCVYTTTPPEGSIPTKPTETPPTTTPTEPATEPPTAAPDPITFTLYSGNENADGFNTQELLMDERDPQIILDRLIEVGVLPEGTALLSLEIQESCLHLDFNDPFLNHLYTMGTAGERMMMGSVVNTFLSAYPEADRITITVNGQIIESGHVVYDFELTFFE